MGLIDDIRRLRTEYQRENGCDPDRLNIPEKRKHEFQAYLDVLPMIFDPRLVGDFEEFMGMRLSYDGERLEVWSYLDREFPLHRQGIWISMSYIESMSKFGNLNDVTVMDNA